MYPFKIWNQGHDGSTMGIRAADVTVVSQLGPQFNRPSGDGVYGTLASYLTNLGTATTPPSPYRRPVDILWRTAIGYQTHRYFTDRMLEVTYNGTLRQQGGFAAQCYVIVDPNGYQALGPHHLVPVSVLVFPGNSGRDLLEVTV